jgi:hypothetical protein
MRVIIAGSRTFGSRRAEVLEAIDEMAAALRHDEVVHEVVCGCAPGVDTIGAEWAVDHGVPIRRFPADWGTYGKSAGPRRNKEMSENADALFLIWDGSSNGSADMRRRALGNDLEVHERVLAPLPVVPMSWAELRAKARGL